MGDNLTDKDQDIKQVRRELKKMLKPGDTVYTILRHCSSSGMSRRISLIAMVKGKPVNLDWWAERLGIAKRHRDKDGLSVGGCGMDMGFHLAYSLGSGMYPHGVNCAGEGRCRSNDHVNGSRDYDRKKKHNDGGYAFQHSWL